MDSTNTKTAAPIKIELIFRTCTNGETALRGLNNDAETRVLDDVACDAANLADDVFERELRKIKGFEFSVDHQSSSDFRDWNGGRWKQGALIVFAYVEQVDDEGEIIEEAAEIPAEVVAAINAASETALKARQVYLEEWAGAERNSGV